MMRHVDKFREWRVDSAPRGQFWRYFAASVFFTFGFSISFFLFNLYLVSCGMTERSLGLIGSMLAVGSLIGTIPAGICAQRFGLGRTLTTALLFAVIFSELRVCIVWEPAQLALALISGIALCCWGVCLAPAVAGLTTEKQRPFAFSLMFASGIGIAGLGGFVAGRLPGWFTASSRGARLSPQAAMRDALLLACGIAALSLPLLWGLKLQASEPRKKMARIFTPFLLRFLPAMAVWGLVTGAFPPFANVYFVHHLGMSLHKMGSVFSLSQVVQFVAILFAPVLFRRLGLTSGVMLTQLATALALAALASLHDAAAAVWIYCAYTGAQNISEPGIFSLLMDKTPASERSGASSYTFFVSAGAQAIASTCVGVGIVRFGYPAVLGVIAALAAVAALLFRRLAYQTRSEVEAVLVDAAEGCPTP